ncbi:DEAD/DEAH box helicase [Pseudoxanthomonas sp. PXM04]|uniref:DEAD/DEAH box helicase n=1 Tax=Pseudoxanthomonas sp. PXM04 TaxID=2769297 RepID=UPI001783F92B|nr:DEAD/DEAH box helicase [Pseudoxanthomonas sp. PXM04]MBD9378051.1 DEAD/DEAH box helicase [Pseudoxanthomonas sp. PXM04]UBB26978.1 DEAD/DEAH box helicase [Pseudoxanthomonas japonensis]
MPLDSFHPAVARWFGRTFPGPTPAQRAAWPAIRAGRHTLVAAPTGSGKTLTAFLAALDDLVRRGLDEGGLPDETAVVYVSPLKALSNDIHLNLDAPLAGIRAELADMGLPDVEIRTAVRTGDTPAGERQKVFRKPPHVLVTTPESLYVLLGSASGRSMLSSVRTVIVDEIHAVAASKRGSHLALSLERLQALCAQPPVRVGLSATQKPIDAVARFLVGAGEGPEPPHCEIVDIGYGKQRDLALELPPTPLGAVMSNDQWEQVYDRVAALVREHRTTLVFVNTRRMAERAARHLGERLGKEGVAAHHGSLAREARLDAEQRLKRGDLKVLVATASLELGLDIGDVDLVCQLGSPRSIATFLQRAGRSGHAVGGVPKARLFPQSRDELIECAALLDCVRRGELDALRIPVAPLDVLAQQLVAETASREWDEDALYALVRRAAPYAMLVREDYAAVVRMLAEGFSTRRGPRAGYLHRDAVHHRLRERKGARMTALMSGGTIPDTGDYAVILEPEAHTIGTVNEDFAVESLSGDVFQLGNASYRILRVEPGRVRVEDARGAPPNIPFWLGEAPGRSDELSFGVSRLREAVAAAIIADGVDAGMRWLMQEVALDEEAARQIADYLDKTLAALGQVPSQSRIVLERFFDESGGTQLILHSPFGSRLNRAWGLALRKRFCRQFNFELQAAATEDAIILSLSTSHSFPLIEVSRYLHSSSALDVLIQALLDAPLFGVRWRWNATTALALPRFVGGRKVPPQLQRMKSEDLLATVFPDQVACLENIVGEREIPDHPLVAQTLDDCLHEAMDADGWLQLLRRLEAGKIEVVARDLPLPSPLAAEVINARPYAFLDDAPLEERRTQAVQSRLYREAESADELGKLDIGAIQAVRAEAWPQPRNPDEMHEALTGVGAITAGEAADNAGWQEWLRALAADGRATRMQVGDGGARALWLATEQLPMLRALFPAAPIEPVVEAPDEYAQADWPRETALRELLRARLTALGPVPATALAHSLALPGNEVDPALLALQSEGYVMQGHFTPGAREEEWCERHLLARIHRYTLKQLRREIEPVEPRDFQRFLFDWQHLSEAERVSGPEALAGVLGQLEGFEAPAASWEADLLPARVRGYAIHWLDDLCTAGRTLWTRLRPPASEGGGRGNISLRGTPILLLPRRQAPLWTRLAPAPVDDDDLGSRARRVVDYLGAHGASFFDEIGDGAHLLRTELEDALAELVVRGRVHCDSFGGLRALLVPASKRDGGSRHRRRKPMFGIQDAGRWALIRAGAPSGSGEARAEAVEHVARMLLRRYGVVCWRLLEREAAWLPPWRELVRIYQRLEARGEIRGGRFITGIPGEQFALPEAVAALRQVRRRPADGKWLAIAATDPANLLGTLLPGEKVARVPGARVLYRDGLAVAVLVAGETRFLELLSLPEQQEASRVLLRAVPTEMESPPVPARAG